MDERDDSMTRPMPLPTGGRRGAPSWRCSFCGGSVQEVDDLVMGPGGVGICERCVEMAAEVFAERRGQGVWG